VGAGLHGGRWNPKGVNVIYTAESRALAALELYANRGRVTTLSNLSLVSLIAPDGVSIKKLLLEDLPTGWNVHPAPDALADIGGRWAMSMETLLLCVPSALIAKEFNYLINPAHAEMAKLRIGEIEEYSFDQRFLC
jgi:RES domain-containing protein